jgi:hypothetical protein
MKDQRLNRQIELQVSGLHVREAEGDKKSRTVEGYAMLFGVRSVNLTPWSSEREVYEIMEPGCITQDLLSRSDVVLTAFHNNQLILGRWRQGKGTLALEIDQRGLKIRCTLAETATADELLSAIERGDISGMSFAFTADEEDNENGVSYEKTLEKTAEGKAVWLRHVKRVTGLYDVTIAGHPAYEQTTIEAREIDEAIKRACGDDDKQREEEEKAAQEAAECAKREQEEREAAAKAEEEAKAKAEEEEKAKAEAEEKEREAQQRHMVQRAHLQRQQEEESLFIN